MSDEEQYSKTITEIREWLVRIDTNQQHQTKLLETLNAQSSNAFTKADSAEAKAQRAIEEARKTSEDLDEYKKEVVVGKRWAIGIAISVGLALLPIITNFYV